MAGLDVHSVLVTGSSRGIGLELVKQLAESSTRPEWIFATCRDPEAPHAQVLKSLAAKHQRVEIILLDVNEPFSIKAAAGRVMERLKGQGLNLLINNAGMIMANRTLESETPEHMVEVYRTNVIGPMLVTQEFLPLMKKASQESSLEGMSCRRAAVINISSNAGSFTTLSEFEKAAVVSYRCSKASLNMLTRCQSLSFAEHKILCVALHPGWLQTEMGTSWAPVKVDDGVHCILNTLCCLSEKENGCFINWDGKVLPW